MKKLKKLTVLLSLTLAFTLLIPKIPNIPNDIVEVNAATVKLNKTKATLVKGKTLTLRVTGTKNKVTWKSSNKKVASVSTKGKVTAKLKGTVTITAKIGNRNLKCKVTVKEKENKTIQGISYELQDTGKGIVAILKNTNKYHVSLNAKIAYYSNGKMIGTVKEDNSAFESGKACALFFHAPYNSNYQYVPYSDYKITISTEMGTNLICASSKIKITSNFGADNVSIQAKNNSDKKLEFITIACVFYDSSGNAIGYEYHYADCKKKGSIDYLDFDFPYNENYETIYPNNYKIYVNNAYTYTWM